MNISNRQRDVQLNNALPVGMAPFRALFPASSTLRHVYTVLASDSAIEADLLPGALRTVRTTHYEDERSTAEQTFTFRRWQSWLGSHQY